MLCKSIIVTSRNEAISIVILYSLRVYECNATGVALLLQ